MRANIYVTRVTLRFLRPARVPEMPTSEQPVANIYGEHRRIDGVSAFSAPTEADLPWQATDPTSSSSSSASSSLSTGAKGEKNRWKNR